LQALDEGIIAGLGIDVVEGEPIDEHHPLLGYKNVVVTPHTSAYTYECLKGMGDKVVDDVEKVLRGEKPDNVINSELLK
jgi:phosphoglycerate dehydrogenase-like enzyme